MFHVVPDAQGVGLRTRPNPAGIIRELALECRAPRCATGSCAMPGPAS
ncbi:MAG: hypothetical protein MZV64_10365 [Ignavibacteriales bacterium]|nr:hypothetical protein [Ignavibacteriales bacterium]